MSNLIEKFNNLYNFVINVGMIFTAIVKFIVIPILEQKTLQEKLSYKNWEYLKTFII